jgi:hypothetical protein
MFHDPQQTQLSMGAYQGAMNPLGLPNTGFAQTGGYAGIQNYGAIAQQQHQLQHQQQQLLHQLQQLQQLSSMLAAQGQGIGQVPVPQVFGIYGQANPWQQHQLLNQNPLLQNPVLAQQLAMQALAQITQSQYGQSQFGQPQFGQGQFGQPQFGQPQFGQPQYAQSWQGNQQTGQLGSPFGQQGGIQSGYPLAPQSWVGQGGPTQYTRGIY